MKIPNRPNLEILAKVTADQCIFASTNLAVFLSTMAVLEGSDPREKLRSTYGNALTKNFMVWPWVQMVNFRFVPLEHRVLVVNGVALGELTSHMLIFVGDMDPECIVTASELDVCPFNGQTPNSETQNFALETHYKC